MTKEVIDSVFEPFFTTKESGKGTGLGMSMVYGFIKQSGGHIRLYSEVGSGTTVTLLIPLARNGDEPGRKMTVRSQLLPHGKERLAVVEDDSMVRSLVEVILSGLGYSVQSFENRAEFIMVLERGAAFDLLLTDVVLPGMMSGRAVAERATEIVPGLKVLYMSGYTENAIVHNGRLDEGIRPLNKPSRERIWPRRSGRGLTKAETGLGPKPLCLGFGRRRDCLQQGDKPRPGGAGDVDCVIMQAAGTF
jgi:CheY-like chemotaxis protein